LAEGIQSLSVGGWEFGENRFFEIAAGYGDSKLGSATPLWVVEVEHGMDAVEGSAALRILFDAGHSGAGTDSEL